VDLPVYRFRKAGDSIMYEWTFSSTAEYVLGVLLVVVMVAVAFA
jgi:hypothetical protein